MGQLAAGVAHDFNNMLTVTIGYAQVLQMDPAISAAAKEKLETIATCGQRAEQLIAQILDFSRQRIVRRQATDLVPFLKEALKLLGGSLPESIDLDLTVDGNPHVVNSNLTQIQQVITNLSLNARDAMPGGGELKVSLSHLASKPQDPTVVRSVSTPYHQELPEGAWSVLAIADTGSGIPPDVLRHVYEPFYTTKAPGSGTGLGLSQVFGIVKQHEGFIEIDTEVDRGTTFRIYLPAADIEPAPLGQTEEGMPIGSGEQILVVEDDEPVLTVVRAMLEQLDYRVVTASNGLDGVRVFDSRRSEFDLVLTDVVMPEMGGLGVAAHVQETSEVPVLLMSGHMLNEEGEALQRLGTKGHLKKPVTITELARAVKVALNA
jgi:CheY-like chemotaxis protein